MFKNQQLKCHMDCTEDEQVILFRALFHFELEIYCGKGVWEPTTDRIFAHRIYRTKQK